MKPFDCCYTFKAHIPSVKPEDSLSNIESDTLGEAHNVLVECTSDILEIGEDESLFGIKSSSNDVDGVLFAVANDFVNSALF